MRVGMLVVLDLATEADPEVVDTWAWAVERNLEELELVSSAKVETIYSEDELRGEGHG
jgi:hypothetical protein